MTLFCVVRERKNNMWPEWSHSSSGWTSCVQMFRTHSGLSTFAVRLAGPKMKHVVAQVSSVQKAVNKTAFLSQKNEWKLFNVWLLVHSWEAMCPLGVITAQRIRSNSIVPLLKWDLKGCQRRLSNLTCEGCQSVTEARVNKFQTDAFAHLHESAYAKAQRWGHWHEQKHGNFQSQISSFCDAS